MKIKILAVLLALFPAFVSAQNKNDEKIFLDSLKLIASTKDYTYYRIVKDYKLEKSQYQFEEYYKSGSLLLTGISGDKDIIFREGAVTNFYENGNKKKSEFFVSNRNTGEYQSWYENGNKKEEGVYLASDHDQKSVLKITHFWNADNIQTVKDGNGEYEKTEEDGTHLKGNLKNGLKAGQWTGTGPNESYTFKESYRNGELLGGESIDAAHNKATYTEISVAPVSKLGVTHFANYVGQNLDISGVELPKLDVIQFCFIVEKNGDTSHFGVRQIKHPKLEKRGLALMKKYKYWQPGLVRGIPSRTAYVLPLRISSR